MTVYLVVFDRCYIDDVSTIVVGVFSSEEKAKEYILNHDKKFTYDEECNEYYYMDGIESVFATIRKWEVK